MGWEVRKERPEERTSPEEYFERYGEAYAESNAIRTIQRRITTRALELLGLGSGKLLDLGCGPGFSMEVLEERGFEVIGVDISDKMVELARRAGFNALRADARELPFDDEVFDGIISISMLQWLKPGDLKKVARECYRVLKPGGRAVMQFYPKSESEMIMVGKAFVKAGFIGEFAIDNPKSPRKRKIYLILEKPRVPSHSS